VLTIRSCGCHISGDSGLSWSTLALADETPGNGSHLYVLADHRLMLVRSDDSTASQLHVSTGDSWASLERDPPATRATAAKYIDVNAAGIVSMYYGAGNFDDGNIGGMPDAPPNRHHFSADLKNWWTIPHLDD
jgi:hypothetical protein